MIKFLFFDLGNVLLSEDVFRFKEYEILWGYLRKEGARWGFEEIVKERERRVQRFRDPNAFLSIGKMNLAPRVYEKYLRHLAYFKQKYRNKYIALVPGMRDVLTILHHYYHLGIIANQEPSVRSILKRFNITHYFNVIAISGELKTAKPGLKIYQWALEKAQCAPEQTVMIGDRLSRDILPAKRLGMLTIWVRFSPPEKGIFAQHYRERLYFQSLVDFPDWPEAPRSEAESPNQIVSRVADIPATLQEMDTGSPAQRPQLSPKKSIWQEIMDVDASWELK